MTTLDDLNTLSSQLQALAVSIGIAGNFVPQLRAAAQPNDIATQGLLDQFATAFDQIKGQWNTVNGQLGTVQTDAQNDATALANPPAPPPSPLVLPPATTPPPVLPPTTTPPTSTPALPSPTASTPTTPGGYTTAQMGGSAVAGFILGLGAGYLAFDGKARR
jgi:hypothetical protein